jgi:putative tricarboxylic transport membrane protein
MDKDIRSDIVVACTMIVISITVVVSTSGYPKVEGQVGARMFPVILAGLLGILSVLLLARSVSRIGRLRDTESESRGIDRRSLRRIAVTVLAVAVYVGLVSWLGFILTSVLFLGAIAVYFGERRILAVVGYSVLGVVVVYLLFSVVARVPFPDGLVEQLLPRGW